MSFFAFSRCLATTIAGPLAALCLSAAGAVAEPAEKIEALQDDLSRAELFSRFIDEKDRMRTLPMAFVFPADTKLEAPGKSRTNAIFGVDISHHNESRCNCKIDWSSFRDHEVRFVYLKATQGERYFDDTFARNWTAIGKLPAEKSLYRGAYHFLSADVDATAQAKHFLRIQPKLDRGDMAPCLDLEWDMRRGQNGELADAWQRVPKSEIAKRALAWLKAVKQETGKTPIIYTNRSWWAERVGEENAALFAEFPIWIADYSASRRASEKPAVMKGTEWLLWQFTEDAKLHINGKASQVDANIYKGPLDGLKAKLGITD